MAEAESFAMFRRSVEERFTKLNQSLDETLAAFASVNENRRRGAAQTLHRDAEDYASIIAAADTPRWLPLVIQAAREFATHPNTQNSEKLMKCLAKHFARIAPVDFTQTVESPYDFDALYSRLRDESRLPELFDALIRAIIQIIQSGAVDSMTVTNGLQQVVDVLKANRTGSFLAARQSISFARFIHHAVIGVLKKIPGVDVLVEAFEKTLAEAEEAFEELEVHLDRESKAAIAKTLPNLKSLTQVVEHGVLALPTPSGTQDAPALEGEI